MENWDQRPSAVRVSGARVGKMAEHGRRRRPSQFELEAAEFFKLDPDQIFFGAKKSTLGPGRNISTSSSSSLSSVCASPYKFEHTNYSKMKARRDRVALVHSNENIAGREPALGSKSKHQKSLAQAPPLPAPKAAHQVRLRVEKSPHGRVGQPGFGHKTNPPGANPRHSTSRHDHQAHDLTACSSASSTNSLPSISSSPSVSPSLVCPHLSLDDILAFRQDSVRSPHTVGLCSRCRLDPPPHIHSPLSPHFRPHHAREHLTSETRYPDHRQPRKRKQSPAGPTSSERPPPRMRRGHSDHQASCQVARKRRQMEGAMQARQKSDLGRDRDDSLDYCLAPAELRRMQISPSLRNSVEFIRRNSIESGRVVRVHKNGQPFEKPLRVCILRDEFSSLNHLLDHINSRLLVPNGARFLFHLDGQPVYSVHELKHGSIYVVSGTRQLEYRTSEVLKECQQREQQALANRVARQEQQTRSPARTGPGEAASRNEQGKSTRGRQAPGERAESGREAAWSETSRSPAWRPSAKQRRRGGAGRVSSERSSVGATRENKFSRYDDATGMPAGGLNASSQSIVAATSDEPSPVRLTRAKSELSALPARKPKKNVTFMDTGRGSSPALSDLSVSQNKRAGEVAPPDGNLRTATDEPAQSGQSLWDGPKGETRRDSRTSEIGIQVSDSIDGYLIDLPVPLPAKGDDSNLARPRNVPRAQSIRASNGRTNAVPAGNTSRRPRQILTITERQLSLEEMNELRDLSAGDHHHEVTIKWDTPAEGRPIESAGHSEQKDEAELEVVPDRTDTIAIGADPGPRPANQSARLIEGANERARLPGESAAAAPSHWQYPGGREKNVTPTERPVSQSGPSETVRARVTTPTPSLSTCGDNNSLTMSYEVISQTGAKQAAPRSKASPRAERLRATPSELPAKERVEVVGKLINGLDEPPRNFRLAWVNGFAINDLYPENTFNAPQEWAGGEARPGGPVSGSSSPSAGLAAGHSASASRGPAPMTTSTSKQRRGDALFKPSERYHNWICHSRKHDELIFPAGTLIVLWSRWTNEQRYYARHTSNVTALTLATLDLDLAASAQVCDLNERPLVPSKVHLWSLTSLNTLLVVQDDHFRSKLIFSLRLRNAKSTGCELSIAARDEKQLLLFELNRKLPSVGGEGPEETPRKRGPEIPKSAAGGQQPSALLLKASMPLQSNQLPLFLLRVPNSNETQPSRQPTQASGEPTISFGRRHFHIWASEPGQRKLRALQSDKKSANFVELISKANCLCRLSPGEFLLGDSEGNVALLLINCNSASQTTQVASGPSTSPKRPVTRTPITGPDASSKYSLEVVNLLGPAAATRADQANEGGVTGDLASQAPSAAAITSIVRVTGSLFMSADASCTLRFWKIKRAPRAQERKNSVPTVRLSATSLGGLDSRHAFSCDQLSSISLPPDLGFICTLIMAQYNLRESLVEFYVVSTSNTILFGSVKLPDQYTKPRRADGPPERRPAIQQVDLLANSSLSVVYEGHETSASSLVADFRPPSDGANQPDECQYFTCSLDCRVCKWHGKQLAWKSLLPSSCAALAVHPTGSVLAVGSLDGTVYILDKLSGLLISYFPLTPVRINCLAYSSDGSLLAAACANGSIFMLPVYERGLKYKKVSIFQSPHPVVSLQFSLDNRYMLTSVTHGPYQELILWDLPNFRYMRDNVKLAADKIRWFDSICSGSEDVRAIWENANLVGHSAIGDSLLEGDTKRAGHKRPGLTVATGARRIDHKREPFIVNLSCHRLIKTEATTRPAGHGDGNDGHGPEENFVVASDTRGYLRLFRYPCYDIQQGFYAIRISSSAVNCCRFLHSGAGSRDQFVSTSLDGSICLWVIE